MLLFFKDKHPSAHWMKNFLIRNKREIKLIKEKKIEKNRRDGFTEEVRTKWFEKLGELLRRHDLIHKPMNIFNVDESGFAEETQCK